VRNGDEEPERERRTVIAYGDASFGPNGVGQLSCPTTRAFKACRNAFDAVVPVDEFRTSKVDFATDQTLKRVAIRYRSPPGCRRGTEERVSPLRQKVSRGLLWCDSTSETQSKFVDRDLNAAKNIWRCATAAERPTALRRPTRPCRLPSVTGCTVTNMLRFRRACR
jgi:hypothetical protein